MSGAFWKTAN